MWLEGEDEEQKCWRLGNRESFFVSWQNKKKRLSPQNPLNDDDHDVFVDTFICEMKVSKSNFDVAVAINFQWGKSICWSIKSYIDEFWWVATLLLCFMTTSWRIFYEVFPPVPQLAASIAICPQNVHHFKHITDLTMSTTKLLLYTCDESDLKRVG